MGIEDVMRELGMAIADGTEEESFDPFGDFTGPELPPEPDDIHYEPEEG